MEPSTEPAAMAAAEPTAARRRFGLRKPKSPPEPQPVAAPVTRQRARAQRTKALFHHIRMVMSGLMLAALAGAGTMGYFLYRGDTWALKPGASLAAVTVVLMAAMLTAPSDA
jgi:small neutral amino acid transporter SnatA (MarC family)